MFVCGNVAYGSRLSPRIIQDCAFFPDFGLVVPQEERTSLAFRLLAGIEPASMILSFLLDFEVFRY
jgi:hypothetical protein